MLRTAAVDEAAAVRGGCSELQRTAMKWIDHGRRGQATAFGDTDPSGRPERPGRASQGTDGRGRSG